jgi:hypothetical protein
LGSTGPHGGSAPLLANFEIGDGGNFRTAGRHNMGPKLSPRVPEMLVILIRRRRTKKSGRVTTSHVRFALKATRLIGNAK